MAIWFPNEPLLFQDKSPTCGGGSFKRVLIQQLLINIKHLYNFFICYIFVEFLLAPVTIN